MNVPATLAFAVKSVKIPLAPTSVYVTSGITNLMKQQIDVIA